MFSKITLIIACCLIFSSCFFKGDKSLDIRFSSDSTKIELNGIEEANLFQLRKHLTDTVFAETLLSVEAVDQENQGADSLIKGNLEVVGNTLVFTPHQPFIKGTTYVVQTVLNSSFGKTKDILKSDLGHNPKLQEKSLER
ncbi:hypothetical protein [Pedobacter chitinilyticus]|uniref:SbsA Ig-like domain-containing protein n=1 Tax=Pedobacter chitinilyticus TaxID=2233776 RepID=A0A3S3QFN7_9SPHI|nr:hypothetical protein [Pedobacter chitinilyticus]RWU07574.1 hypothetical protein DPV69_11350 [Pedobacter chitinilyticus]